MSGLVACKRKDKLVTKKSYTGSKSISIKKDGALSNTIYVNTVFPNDTIYPARILTSGGVFHEDEIDPNSESYNWKGIFRSDSGYYVTDTKISLSREYDAVLDEEGKKTGWMVSTSIKDSAILLLSGLNFLPNANVPHIKLLKEQLLPGEQELFIYKDIKYTLYATGSKKHETPKSAGYNISNYKLFLRGTVNGQSYNQLLVSVSNFDDAMTTIVFAGDIDGDGIPDLIIDTTSDYNAEVPTLYLSKPALKGDLLKVMGMHVSVGC